MSSSTSPSALASYLPTLLLIPVGFVLWKFSSPPPAATSRAGSSSPASSTTTDGGQSSKASKKKKKAVKPAPADAAASHVEQPKVSAPDLIPQDKPKAKQPAAPKPAPIVAPADAPSSGAEVVKKGKKKSNKLKALAAEDKSKPLAELHAEREAKRLGASGVEDMLPPVLPPARVMKIASSTTYEEPKKAPTKAPSSPSSISSLEDESDARPSPAHAALLSSDIDDGWEQAPAAEDEQWETIPVKSKAKKPLNNPLFSSTTSSSAAATSAAASAASAKKARQNAARAEAKKAAKQDSEAERLRALAAHKKRLEQARIEEIYNKGRGKVIGGGMTASVSKTGKLEWS